MISIAMATYNGEKYLAEQLDSILAQTVQDFELIVCDDCSSDSTAEILSRYAEKDSRIKIFVNEKNLGFVKNFEKAVSLCSGEYIALSDQDDVWFAGHLEILLRNIKDKDLICGNAVLCDENLKTINTDLLSVSKIDFLPDNKDDWFFFLLHGNIFQGAASLFKSNIIEKALPIPSKVKFHDRWLALVAASENGVSYITKPILYYRRHGENITHIEKWNIFLRIKNALFYDDYQNTEIHIDILKAFALRFGYLSCIDVVKESIEFYESLNNLRRFIFSGWFLKNYKRMRCSRNFSLKIMRFFKKIILGK